MAKSFVNRVSKIAADTGVILLNYCSSGFSVGNKQGMEYITEADMAAEDFLKKELELLLPGSAFIGEESWNGKYPEPPVWIVDPLDGTNNYASGIPFFCVSIALQDSEGISLGCIHDPVHSETFIALRGGGAFLNGKEICASKAQQLSEAIVATGFPYSRTEDDLHFDIGVLTAFLGRVRGLRRCGSAALDLAYTAAGRLGGFWEESLNPWDMAAGVILVREAGGIVTGFREKEWTIRSKGVQCSAPGIWKEFSAIIEKRPV